MILAFFIFYFVFSSSASFNVVVVCGSLLPPFQSPTLLRSPVDAS
jgi:hypothetical protein